MPEVIMVASWRVMTVSSAALTRPKERSALRTDFFSLQLHDLQALGRSSSVTASLVGALDLALGRDAGPVDGLVGPDRGAHQAATMRRSAAVG